MSDKPFTREDLARADVKLLRDGRAANAVVTCVTWKGRRWTVKDFSSRSWWVRRFLAPFLLGREIKILHRLRGVDGVAEDAFRIDADAIAVSFVEGRNLSRVTREEVTIEFLEAFEKLLDAMHARDVVHLDLRGTGNIVMRPDGSPALIDFQASLVTSWMPAWLRRLLEDMDRSGALKKWRKFHPEAMGEERERELERIDRLRRYWIFRGYFGKKKKHRRSRF